MTQHATATAPKTPRRSKKRGSVLPGFTPTMGFTIAYLSLIVLIPLSTVFLKTAGMSWAEFVEAGFSTRVLAAYKLTFGTAFLAALVNAVFGLLLAWVLVRYRFPGRRLIDGMVDLPFALPTAVAGIALTAIYSRNGWMGSWLEDLGIKVAYTPIGITIALIFIGLPFVVRTLQPVIEEIDVELEEAAATLGAGRWTIFRKVLFPTFFPALLTGFALAFARGIGEYGSVVFISGNMPMRTEIAPLLIVTKLEQYDYMGATAIALVMLVISFFLLLAINLLQRWSSQRIGHS
ncbi:MAG: sulfate ABC transporter permease subunit CysT [Puniceicoccaceae bacterium]|nr:sulfate ABC transporter permease subunit CysT [Puniceicoccaceae bacterium]